MSLNEARLAHSAARKTLASFPVGARPDLELAERDAWTRVQDELAKVAAQPVKRPCLYKHCCDKAEHVAGTWYAHETNCQVHGNRTIGTME